MEGVAQFRPTYINFDRAHSNLFATIFLSIGSLNDNLGLLQTLDLAHIGQLILKLLQARSVLENEGVLTRAQTRPLKMMIFLPLISWVTLGRLTTTP